MLQITTGNQLSPSSPVQHLFDQTLLVLSPPCAILLLFTDVCIVVKYEHLFCVNKRLPTYLHKLDFTNDLIPRSPARLTPPSCSSIPLPSSFHSSNLPFLTHRVFPVYSLILFRKQLKTYLIIINIV